MKNRVLCGPLALVLTVSLGTLSLGLAPKNRAVSEAPAAWLGLLPPSDAVAIVKVRRVLDEVLPKLLVENPAKLAAVNEKIERFKTRTGIDLRSFDEAVFAMRYSYPAEGITKVTTVALANGAFNAGAIVAAGRLAAGGKYQEQRYQGKTIHIFALDQNLSLFGLDLKVRDLAVSAIDTNTLALGDLDGVRAVIDVSRVRNRANAELISLASRDPNAIVGFGGNISRELLQNLSISNDAIARDLTAVRQVYGSLGMSETNLELMVAARTVDSYSAKNLSDMVEGLKQFGGLFTNRLGSAKGTLARGALNNLRVTTQGNEIQIRTAVAPGDIAPLMRGF